MHACHLNLVRWQYVKLYLELFPRPLSGKNSYAKLCNMAEWAVKAHFFFVKAFSFLNQKRDLGLFTAFGYHTTNVNWNTDFYFWNIQILTFTLNPHCLSWSVYQYVVRAPVFYMPVKLLNPLNGYYLYLKIGLSLQLNSSLFLSRLLCHIPGMMKTRLKPPLRAHSLFLSLF